MLEQSIQVWCFSCLDMVYKQLFSGFLPSNGLRLCARAVDVMRNNDPEDILCHLKTRIIIMPVLNSIYGTVDYLYLSN